MARTFRRPREEAERRAQFAGLHMVPSFHPDLVLGVATYALELFRAAPDLDVLYVPIGQGSGICGCIMARDLLGLKTEIVGVQSTEAPSYALSFAAGKVVTTETSNTLADGMATRIPDAGSARDHPQGRLAHRAGHGRRGRRRDPRLLDRHAQSRRRRRRRRARCGASGKDTSSPGKRVGLVLSGGNIDFDLFRSWVGTEAPVAHRAMA